MRCLLALILIIMTVQPSQAQFDDYGIKVFGYFQNQFQYRECKQPDSKATTFNLQQLNLFLQKEVSDKWISFIHIELLNSYSMSNKWGAMNLEEAWVRYRGCKELSFKFGLQIPIFNNLLVLLSILPTGLFSRGS